MNTNAINGNNANTGVQWAGFMKIKAVLQLVQVSRATWYAGVKSGRYPAPVHPSPGSSAWIAADIQALIAKISKVEVI